MNPLGEPGLTRVVGGVPTGDAPCSFKPESTLLVEHAPTLDEVARSLLPQDEWTAQGVLTANEKKVVVESGDTLISALARGGVSRAEAMRWYSGARPTYDLARLKIGQVFTLHVDPDTGQLEQLMLELDKLAGVLVEDRATESGRGHIVARRIDLPSRSEVRGAAGSIRSTMAAACREAQVPPRIVAAVAEAFGGEIDFNRLRRGDSFRILWEMRTSLDGSYAENGRLIAVEIEARGKKRSSYRYEDDRGQAGYFDADGRSLGGSGFGRPLERARVTSLFSYSRQHPVLGRRRPHYGVDFAARTGTPVRAIASGVVRTARWDGQLGRAIRLEHGGRSGITSVYGHLSGFARDVRAGERVVKGQIIGFVGSTGLSTGPHLHLAILDGRRYVDPLQAMRRQVAADPVLDDEGFERRRDELAALLGEIEPEAPVRLVARSGT